MHDGMHVNVVESILQIVEQGSSTVWMQPRTKWK